MADSGLDVRPLDEEEALLATRNRTGRGLRIALYVGLFIAVSIGNVFVLRALFPVPSVRNLNSGGGSGNADAESSIVLVSIDGCRWDYLDLTDDSGEPLAPTLNRIRESGVSAKGMQPVMPSKTFPNHWSLATGLYPAWSGIIDNKMYRPSDGASFSTKDHKDPSWWYGDPLWSTVQAAGFSAATVFWPGSEVKSDRFQSPDVFLDYDGDMPYDKRVNTALEFLQGVGMPNSVRPAFVTLYLNNVDGESHAHGPNSEEVRAAIREADAALAKLLDGIADVEELRNTTSVVVVSDHGMQEIRKEDAIVLEDEVDTDGMIIPTTYPLGQFYPEDGSTEDANVVYQAVSALETKYGPDRVQVLLLEDTPEAWHYAEAPNAAPVVSLCAPGISLVHESDVSGLSDVWGNHGYDATDQNMQAIFLATGPSFPADGRVVEEFEVVDVYGTICAALQIQPAAHNGSASRIASVLE